ncbi:MAG TPA: hypothetical protein VFS43_43055 [Polyangiaceae bacterium]|nr:hypothetical protein [Polyangiaceae bacterium]
MSRPPAAGTSIKGTSLLGILKAIERAYGEAGLRATLDAAPAEIRDAYRYGQIVSVGWYPTRWYCDVHRAARRAFGEGRSLPWRLSHDAVTRDFRGIFQVVVRLLSPEMALRQAPRLLLLYCKGGTVEAVEARRGYGRLRFEGWPDYDENLWSDLQGGVVALLEVCGAKNVITRVLAGGGDHDHLDVEARWGEGAP